MKREEKKSMRRRRRKKTVREAKAMKECNRNRSPTKKIKKENERIEKEGHKRTLRPFT